MREIEIKDLAYFMKEAKENNLPKPIFFLGAGASVTGGIPLANKIAERISDEYKKNPFVERLVENGVKDYAQLMEAISPQNRNELLRKIIHGAKINVTHIYLAQMLKEDYVDYVLTVNFDNLMLRALALFNIFPPTFDLAILKDLTTSKFQEKSVVYLHGQYRGVWLLNTQEEMERNSRLESVFRSIADGRMWVFIGYSGSDPVFDEIQRLGRFDNGLFWVNYKDSSPQKQVKDFLEKANLNAHLIKGYDADAFMLKLNEELGLPQPQILDSPFSALQTMLNEIEDINDEEHFKGIKLRLQGAIENTAKAIEIFEKHKDVDISEEELEVNDLKDRIIKMIIAENYDNATIAKIRKQVQELNDGSLTDILSDLYFNWGNALGNLADLKGGEDAAVLYGEAIEKYKEAVGIKSDKHEALYNWGNTLVNLAGLKGVEDVAALYAEAIEKYKEAVGIKPDEHEAFNNWGVALMNLADLKGGEDAAVLYGEAIEKYKEAVGIKPDKHEALYNWGVDLVNLAGLKGGKNAAVLYAEAIEKYKEAVGIKSDKHEALYNWGNTLVNLADLKGGEDAAVLYGEAIEKYKEAVGIKSDKHEALYNWGNTLVNLADLKGGEDAAVLYAEAIEKYKEAMAYGGSSYNLSCLYALRNDKDNALSLLSTALSRKDITVDFVLQDEDWSAFLGDEDFKALIRKFS